jgi:hypothetical protein
MDCLLYLNKAFINPPTFNIVPYRKVLWPFFKGLVKIRMIMLVHKLNQRRRNLLMEMVP